MGGCCSKPKTKEAPKPENKPAPKPERVARPELVQEVPKAAPPSPRTVRMRAIGDGKSNPFTYNRCTVEGGDVKACFAEGLIFRIIKDGAWYIYNDTLDYEAHVNYRFGPGSHIVAGEHTTLEQTEDGWTCAHAVVHPLETILYISGTYNGYKSDITAVPITGDYHSSAIAQANAVAAAELRAVEELAAGETDDEAILRMCVDRNVPYVDINFPPTQAMLARPEVDGRTFPEVAMQRPTQYLSRRDAVKSDAVIGAVVPQSVAHGNLGDCWLMCAAAIMAESPNTIEDIFQTAKPAEKAVGGHRVCLSKHGWWRSVIVDTYLPTVNGMPVFGRVIDDPRELWVSLYQKAYAKVHGSYASITGGDALQALQDFTGAPVYRFDKDWEAAATDSDAARALVAKLISYSHKGYGLVLNTPGHDSTSYLGVRRQSDPEAFKAMYSAVGLRSGYTYYVAGIEPVRTSNGKDTVLLKIRNPWTTSAKILSLPEWDRSKQAREAREAAAAEDIMCISWETAVNYFDGGGVVYAQKNSTDYRVQGWFDDTHPNIVLEVSVAEPVEVMLVLSQPDKRGVSPSEPQSRFAPIMLSVSHGTDGEKQRVQRNTSWDPECPSTDYNFVVARDVAMKYTFEPSDKPYMVIPRIHRKGVQAGYVRPYVLGVIANGSLEGKLNVELKSINKENRVFKNIISFVPENMFTVEAEHQVHQVGATPTTRVSSILSTAAVQRRAKTPSVASASEHNTEEAISNDGEEHAEVAVTQVNVIDGDGAPVEIEDRAITPVADDMAPAEDIHAVNSDEDSSSANL